MNRLALVLASLIWLAVGGSEAIYDPWELCFSCPIVPSASDRTCSAGHIAESMCHTDQGIIDSQFMTVSTMGSCHLPLMRLIGSPLGNHISRIIGGGSEEKVLRVNTGSDIAFMANEQSCGNGAIMEFPRDPVGTKILAITSEQAVPAVDGPPLYASPPYPAAISYLYFSPESVCKGLSGKLPGWCMLEMARRSGIIDSHGENSFRYATPPAVSAARGYSIAKIIAQTSDPSNKLNSMAGEKALLVGRDFPWAEPVGTGDWLFQIQSLKSETDMSWPSLLPPPAAERDVSDRSGHDGVAPGDLATAADSDGPDIRPAPLRPGRRLRVRLTYYTDVGRMRTGYQTFAGAASVDPGVIPHGTVFRIVGDETLRVALDTGSLVRGAHTDIWMPSDQAGRELIRRFGEYTEIEIIQEAQ